MIVVVGGRGVIGGAIVDALRTRGESVTVVSHDPQASQNGCRYGDVLRPETLPLALQDAEVVVQSVNFPTYPIAKRRHGNTFHQFDRDGTRNLVAAARKVGARRYVFVGGAGAAPAPSPPYLQAIWEGEESVLASGLEGVCLEPTFVYGPRDRGLNRIVRFAKWLPVLGGQQLHQPVSAADVGVLAAHADRPDAPVGRFPIGGPDRMTLIEMLQTALEVAGLRRTIAPVPVGIARMGAPVLERLPGPPLTRDAIDFLADDFVADNAATLSYFGAGDTDPSTGPNTLTYPPAPPPRADVLIKPTRWFLVH